MLLWALFFTLTLSETTDPPVEEPEYKIPVLNNVFFYETFQNGLGQWKPSSKPKFTGGIWRVGRVEEDVALKGEQGLILTKAAQHHAISTKFSKPIGGVEGKSLVIQYEVRLHKQLQCGGAYLKLLADTGDFSPETFDNETPYIIMFGPDKCGTNDKVHFIFRHQNPISKVWEEKHLKNPPVIKNDRLTHLYTLIVRSDNTYEILIDQESAKTGNLHEDFLPAVNPPKEIDDPNDVKPSDWVDEATIKDPAASKPEDWDEDAPQTIIDETDTKPAKWCDDCPTMVPDPEGVKPDDWEDEVDGEWTAPLVENPICNEVGCGTWEPRRISNPAYKGKWQHPMIPNPAYKGPWAPRQIANPHYFEDANPHKLYPMIGAGFEIWTMQEDIEFDNILIDHSEDVASKFATDTWAKKHAFEKANDPLTNLEENYSDTLVEYATENPGILVGVIIGIATILVMAVIFCCSSSPKPERTEQKTIPEKRATTPTTETKATTTETKSATAEAKSSQVEAEDEPDREPAESSETVSDGAKKRPKKTPKQT